MAANPYSPRAWPHRHKQDPRGHTCVSLRPQFPVRINRLDHSTNHSVKASRAIVNLNHSPGRDGSIGATMRPARSLGAIRVLRRAGGEADEKPYSWFVFALRLCIILPTPSYIFASNLFFLVHNEAGCIAFWISECGVCIAWGFAVICRRRNAASFYCFVYLFVFVICSRLSDPTGG
jgi:hypothetical protein